MLRPFVVGGVAVLLLALTGTALAQSSCDAGVTRAVARKVSCKLKVHAIAQKRGTAADAAKLARCEEKFATACARAKSRNDCEVQPSSCDAIEAAADAAVDDLRGVPASTATATATATATPTAAQPCGPEAGGTCGGSCQSGTCAQALNGECICFRPCGLEQGGTCGGFCDFYPLEQCVEDEQTGDCRCFLPCTALGGIGQCQGECPAGQVCTFVPDPSFPCVCQ